MAFLPEDQIGKHTVEVQTYTPGQMGEYSPGNYPGCSKLIKCETKIVRQVFVQGCKTIRKYRWIVMVSDSDELIVAAANLMKLTPSIYVIGGKDKVPIAHYASKRWTNSLSEAQEYVLTTFGIEKVESYWVDLGH